MGKTLLRSLIVCVVCYAVVCMWHWPIGFTFFTQLSNVFAALTVLAQLLAARRRPGGDDGPILHGMKFSAVLSVFLTFLVYLTAIAPLSPGGMAAAYMQDHGASLCMHGIVPFLMLVDFFLHDAGKPYGKRHMLLGLVPPAAWFVFIRVLVHLGVRWRGSMTAPYPFLNTAAPAGWFGFAPETAGPASFGIGVFYALAFLAVLILLISRLQLYLAGVVYRKRKEKTTQE